MTRLPSIAVLLAVLSCSIPTTSATSSFISSQQLASGVPALPLRLWRHLRYAEASERSQRAEYHSHARQIAFQSPSFPASSSTGYEAHTFPQLVSHDPDVPAPTKGETFNQRYWFDASFYKPGGPVFFLDAGETDGEGRLPFLKEGILRILSEATGGLGVVFEHRYYGQSFPVQNLSTDSLRYLTTMQSLQDTVKFAENIVFPGLEGHNLTSKDVPWIYYGGSYAGAKAAFARKLFPDVWHGGIASSAVTTAIVDFWEYYEPIRLSAPSECIALLQNHTVLIDSLLSLAQPLVTSSLKGYFGLSNVTSDIDFVNALAIPLGAWQARNWDPEVGSSAFDEFCKAVVSQSSDINGSETEESVIRVLGNALPNLPKDPKQTFASFSAYAAFIKNEVAALCPEGEEQDDCFGTDAYVGEGLEEAPWRSWTYQYCTEWGYFMGAPPAGKPSLLSTLITTEYTAQVCRKAFPPGQVNAVPMVPNVTAINQWGSFDFSYPRLAFIDGSEDPWLYATPHSPHASKPDRRDSTSEPFKLIPGGVHHWDENGRLDGNLPPAIEKVHSKEIAFVKSWLADWNKP